MYVKPGDWFGLINDLLTYIYIYIYIYIPSLKLTVLCPLHLVYNNY